MEQYIDKSALVAEIEKRYNECLKRAKIIDSDYWNGNADAYRNVLAILNDTSEVKECKEEPECKIFPRPIGCYSTCKECPLLAANNKAQKGKRYESKSMECQ